MYSGFPVHVCWHKSAPRIGKLWNLPSQAVKMVKHLQIFPATNSGIYVVWIFKHVENSAMYGIPQVYIQICQSRCLPRQYVVGWTRVVCWLAVPSTLLPHHRTFAACGFGGWVTIYAALKSWQKSYFMGKTWFWMGLLGFTGVSWGLNGFFGFNFKCVLNSNLGKSNLGISYFLDTIRFVCWMEWFLSEQNHQQRWSLAGEDL